MRWFSLWAPVFGFMALIWLLSGQSDVPAADYVSDKLLHVIGYGVFGLLCLRAWHGGLGRLRGGRTLAAILLAVGYAAVDEFHQSWVPGRFSSVGDWVADVLGVGLAVLFVAALRVVARVKSSGTGHDPR